MKGDSKWDLRSETHSLDAALDRRVRHPRFLEGDIHSVGELSPPTGGT
jgi:hypothetical protein